MKRKITIDTLLNQTLGFNTKSFSESKPIMKPTKRFNYGEVGNAMLVFEIDRYMMKAEAANSRTRLATQFATGEASIVDKAKSVGKAIWDAIIKLFKSLQDMIKNFLSRNKDVEKKLINAANALMKYEVKLYNDTLFSPEKIKKAKESGTVFKVIADYGMVHHEKKRSDIIGAASFMFTTESDSVTKFLNALVPNGADENLSARDYEKKLTKIVLAETSDLKKRSAKYKKEGPKMRQLGVEDTIDAIHDIVPQVLDLASDIYKSDLTGYLKEINAAIDKSIKELQSFKAVPDEKGNVTAVSDNNLTKARLSLHKVSTSVNAYIDSAYVTYTNITKSILLTIKNIDSLS